MSELISEVNWIAVVVGTVLAYVLGAAWYSTKMFGTKWAEGVGVELSDDMKLPVAAMSMQFVATFCLAWVIGIMATTHALYTAILICVVVVTMIAANGMFAQKSCYAIATESGFIASMSFIMIVCQGVL
jgi:hypothetical protein